MKLIILLTLISLVYGGGPKKNCDCDDQLEFLLTNISQEFTELKTDINSNVNFSSISMLSDSITDLKSKLLSINQTCVTKNLTNKLFRKIDQVGESVTAQLTSQFSDLNVYLRSNISGEVDNNTCDNIDSIYDYFRPLTIAILVLVAVNLLLTIVVNGLVIGGLVWIKLI